MKRALTVLLIIFMLVYPSCSKDENSIRAMTTNTDTVNELTEAITEDIDTSVSDEIKTITEEDLMCDGYTVMNYNNIKALWISQFDLSGVYCSGKRQRSEKEFTKLIKQILKNTSDTGINTIIVQVRPNADSMYPSEYYPMSAYVVGEYGKQAEYDPVEIIVKEAHAIGLSVQAWINPLRGMLESEIKNISDDYPLKRWYEDSEKKGKYVVICSGRLYLNPAYSEVRQLIVDGAREIIEKYDVDGLHMDDYFYPTQDASFDSYAYDEYKKNNGRSSLADWRREMLNILVSDLWKTVKTKDEKLLFGISPAGNYDTVYNKQYADIYTWCGNEGYIDYICPQVYFGMEHGSFDFVKTSLKYQSMIKTDKVKLIIGMTLGKALNGSKGVEDQYAGSGKREWIEKNDILYRELKYTEKLEKCTGVAYFCYQYFYDPLTGKEISGTKTERDRFVPLLKEISDHQ